MRFVGITSAIGMAMVISMMASCAGDPVQGVNAGETNVANAQAGVDDCAQNPQCPAMPVQIQAMAAAGAQEPLVGCTNINVDWVIVAKSQNPARRVLLKVDNPPAGLQGQATPNAPIYRVTGVPMSVQPYGSINVLARDVSRCEADPQRRASGQCANLNTPMQEFDTQRAVQFNINEGMVGYNPYMQQSQSNPIGSSILNSLAMGALNTFFSGSGLGNIGGLLGGLTGGLTGGATGGQYPNTGYPNTGYPNTGVNGQYPNSYPTPTFGAGSSGTCPTGSTSTTGG